MRTKCPFTFRGRPTTKPNTPEDAKRIKLSLWITAILVKHGDEEKGAYAVPGATGYTDQELAEAETRYAHLSSQEAKMPEAEQKLQSLALLQAGISLRDIAEELDVPSVRFKEWRTDEAFAAEWDAAKAEGNGQKVRSNPRRDALLAQRAQPVLVVSPPPHKATSIPPPIAMPTTSSANVVLAQQAVALEKLRAGAKSGAVLKDLKITSTKLAEWRKDPDFATLWDEARAQGRPTTSPKQPRAGKRQRAERSDAEVQAEVFALLETGAHYKHILTERLVPGFYTNKLTLWRKDAAFLEKWHAALALNRAKRGAHYYPKKSATLTATTTTIPDSVMEQLQITPTVVSGPYCDGDAELFDQMLLLFGKEAVAAFYKITAYKHRMQAGKKPGNSIEQDISSALWYESRLRGLAA